MEHVHFHHPVEAGGEVVCTVLEGKSAEGPSPHCATLAGLLGPRTSEAPRLLPVAPRPLFTQR